MLKLSAIAILSFMICSAFLSCGGDSELKDIGELCNHNNECKKHLYCQNEEGTTLCENPPCNFTCYRLSCDAQPTICEDMRLDAVCKEVFGWKVCVRN